jgi:hypothetical protein
MCPQTARGRPLRPSRRLPRLMSRPPLSRNPRRPLSRRGFRRAARLPRRVLMPSAPKTGSWWGLISTLRQSQQEFDAYWSLPPMACPQCGEPLTNAPTTDAGTGKQLFCKYDGWSYPRDHHPPSRPGGRTL